ncbi:MAG: hypothetical protein KIT61_00780 [Pyrinomonadaceae bacterium]|nr:hypothetical protein [Pyrinomonadaceae bacterium]
MSKNSIALEEAREANYWIRLILASYDLDPQIRNRPEELRDGSQENALIIGAIIVSARDRG